MRLVVVGLGAVGGLVAARLALAGHTVAALARPAVVEAVARHGGVLLRNEHGPADTAPVAAASEASAIGAADLLFIALKGHALATAAAQLGPLIAPTTTIVPLMNGVPWWFMQTVGDHAPLASVDPQGQIATTLPLRQTLGAVVHLTCSSPAPGEVQHGFGERLILGPAEPGASPDAKARAVAELLTSAGFKAELSNDIRRDIWFKLWGNMTMNPISALTRASCDAILDDELVRDFMARGMAEAAAIGARIGCPIDQSAEDRMNLTRKLGAFKTSMLQDAEAGRQLELDALVGAVREIGQRVGVATPNIDTLLGLTRLLARQTKADQYSDT